MATTNKITVPSGLFSMPADQSYLFSFIFIFLTATVVYWSHSNGFQWPILNPRKTFGLSNLPRLRRFMNNSINVLTEGTTQFLKSPYRLFCEWGEVIVLPPDSVDHVRSDRRFDFSITASEDSHSYIPGFEAFINDPAMPKVVTRYLTKALTKVTGSLSKEAAIVIEQVITNSTEWHVFNVQQDVMSIVSRMSSKVFMGEELCRDREWNKASAYYTLKAFEAGSILSEWPRWLRPYIHWFMPCCWEVRRASTAARKHLAPHIQKREQVKTAAFARGEKSPFDDSIEWFAQLGSNRQPATCQISLSLVAIHTTTDLLSETMLNIATYPELFQAMREEVIRVLSAQGLKKEALYNLKLMDSVFKETQRLKPILLSWRRMATEDVTLPNDMVFKKGQKLAVSSTHMWHDDYYEDAKTFNPYRFLRMRETPGKDHMAHLVSTSSDHLGFGHGVHACPGRFFASNEVKIALCHLIMKYEWKLMNDERPPPCSHGMMFNTNPTAKLLIRRRQEELDLSTLEY